MTLFGKLRAFSNSCMAVFFFNPLMCFYLTRLIKQTKIINILRCRLSISILSNPEYKFFIEIQLQINAMRFPFLVS